MKMKFSILFLLILIISSCEKNEIELSFEERSKRAMEEVMDIYSKSRPPQTTYEEVVSKVQIISNKYKIDIEPITRYDYLTYFSFSENARVAEPCSGDFSQEIVSEGNGCIGLVWHYSNGATGFQRLCQDQSPPYATHSSGFECYSMPSEEWVPIDQD